MAALGRRALVDAILQAIQDSGYSGTFLGPRINEHPRRFAIASPEGGFLTVWVYVWTLTHGGRDNLPDEYRIQMTTVSSPLALNPSGHAILIGYEPSLGLFAGFDLNRHRQFTSGSPSVQVNINTIRNALQFGLSFDRKSNDEIAIGIRPNHLVDYINNADELHRLGRFPDTFRLLNKATALEAISQEDIDNLAQPRKRIVETVSRLTRNGNFRQQVMQAYDNRCAVTRAQLRLVDAAHILPVGAPESTDNVRNGIALSPTYHRAYDAGLVYLDDTFVMKLNPARVAGLRQLRLDGGLQGFQSHLGRILLPPDQQQWPSKQIIRLANQYRNVS
jgi:putative restriction endonuclease